MVREGNREREENKASYLKSVSLALQWCEHEVTKGQVSQAETGQDRTFRESPAVYSDEQ